MKNPKNESNIINLNPVVNAFSKIIATAAKILAGDENPKFLMVAYAIGATIAPNNADTNLISTYGILSIYSLPILSKIKLPS
jgi:hypothetical protein